MHDPAHPTEPRPPLLSICIPTFDRRDYLETCLASVQAELDRNPGAPVEVVVVDNASPDGTAQLLQEWGGRMPGLRSFRNEVNIGIHNFPRVIAHARGEYCWFLGDDDALLPGSLRLVLDHLGAGRDIYLGWAIETDAELRPIGDGATWYTEPLARLDYDLGREEDLLDYMSRCRYMAGLFAFMSILVFRRDRWMAQEDLRARWPESGYPHQISLLGMTRRACPFRCIPDPLVYKRLGNDRHAQSAPWHRMYMDVREWAAFGKGLFGDRPTLREAFHALVRRNHTDGIIKVLRNAPSETDWAEAKRELLTLGFDPLAIGAVELGWNAFHQLRRPSPRLSAEGLCLADRGFVLRGARRLALLASGGVSEALRAASLLQALHAALPRTEFLLVAPTQARSLLEACPFDVTTRWIPEDRLGAEDLRHLAAFLQDFQPDVVLNTSSRRELVLDLLVQETGAVLTCGFEGSESGTPPEAKTRLDWFYTGLVSEACSLPDSCERLLACAGLEIPPPRLTCWPSAEDGAWAQEWMSPIPHDALALLELGETPPAAWAQALAGSPPLCIVLVGPAGAPLGDLNLPADTRDLSGELSPGRLAALIQRSRIVLGGEGDAAHLACALGIPNLVVAGGGRFGQAFPYDPLTTLAVRPLQCYFCDWQCEYDTRHCLEGLAPEVLARALEMALEAREPLPRVVAQVGPEDESPPPLDLGPLLNPAQCRLRVVRTN
jgi:glycosyltransferase involved in cell wall biosynthesis